MTNLIPMAGTGTRFSAENYKTPKPLIEVSGRPMIIQAANSLPAADRWVFICQKEHINNYPVKEVLKEEFVNNKIILIDYVTEGQASTCLLAEPFIADDEPLLIGACDNGMLWDEEKYNSLVSGDDVDAFIWTFRNNMSVKKNPHMYGWVAADEDNNALSVSCKVPISDNPMHDHAVVGTFYFRKASYFFDAAKKMIAKNLRIRNEFYVDEAMNELIGSGLNVKVFEIDKYICWGTPDDLRTYQYWEDFFHRSLKH